MNADSPTGLFAGDLAIPLEGVRVDARLAGLAVEVVVTQRYRNREAVPVEAVYVFPLEATAAVSGFSARVGDRLIVGRVEEREAAFAIYDDAMAEGHGAFLLDQERPNVFTASVGNLRPGEAVEVELRYVALATVLGAATRLMIPTTVTPRYVPADVGVEVGQPDGERVNPEVRREVPYGLTLSVDVSTSSRLVGVSSPSHPIATRLRADGATVELGQEEAALDRDFVLLVEAEAAHQPHAVVACEEDGARVCMVTFAPDPGAVPEQGSEVLFLLDCSGSMGGDAISQARRALELCVRALSARDTFNVTRFGSTHESLWPAPRSLDDANLDAAVAWVRASHANLGGTEVLRPMQELLERPADPERARQVLLLTDGAVSNEDKVIALAERNASGARIFSFGIGAGASEHLVRGVAEASRGAAEFIFPGERIEPKVLRMFNRVRTPALTDVAVGWGGLEVEQRPRATPPVFAGDLLTVFGRVSGGEATEVTLTAGGQRWVVPIDLERASVGGPIPTLWARSAIADLEAGAGRGSSQRRPEADARRREQLVALAKRYGLMSSATSYVAVEERAAGDRTASPAALRKIPIALTAGYGGTPGILGARGGRGGATVNKTMGAPPTPGGTLVFGAPPPAPMAPGQAAAPKMRGAGGVIAQVGEALSGLLSSGSTSRKRKVRVADEREEAGAAALFDEPPARRARSVPSAPAPEPEPSDRLYDLLATQRADGTFRPSEGLRAWLGAKVAALDEAIAAHGEALVVTAVVVALLERDEASREPEWRQAANKARAWLAAQPGGVDVAAVLTA